MESFNFLWNITWSNTCAKGVSFLVDRITRTVLVLLAFTTRSESLEILQIYDWSIETMLLKKLLKIFLNLYSFLVNWLFSSGVMDIQDPLRIINCRCPDHCPDVLLLGLNTLKHAYTTLLKMKRFHFGQNHDVWCKNGWTHKVKGFGFKVVTISFWYPARDLTT